MNNFKNINSHKNPDENPELPMDYQNRLNTIGKKAQDERSRDF
jgi:hypothetical protein